MTRLLGLVAIVLVGVILAGCQSAAPAPAPAPAPAKDTAKAAPPSLEAELYEAAKKEGKVIFYPLSWTDEELTLVVGAFNKKYPGIEVTYVKMTSGDTINRILAEAPAGRLSLDVSMTGVASMTPLIERDLVLKYDWAKVADIPSGNILLDGRFLATYDAPFGWYYNSKVVTAADVPKKWEDLLDPKWKGKKIAVPTLGVLGVEALAINGLWDKDKYTQFVQKLKDQELVVETSSATIAEKVASGQIPLGTGGFTFVASAKARGAPLEIAPLGPITTQRYGVYTLKGVPHPNAAKLLVSFLGSKDSEELWKNIKRGPASPCGASDVAALMCGAKVEAMLEDGGAKTKAINDYSDLNRKLLGLPSR